LTVTLHVADYAAISPRDLAAAEAYATAIYAGAGIQTVWTDAPWVPGEPRSPHLRVVILSHEMTAKKCRESRLGRSVMGVAVDGAPEGGGRIAYVFADRIGQTAMQYLARFERALAHAMAHEVGHLLIGDHSHAPAGLMAAGWYPLERRLQTFTPEQAQLIRLRARATGGHEPGQHEQRGNGPARPLLSGNGPVTSRASRFLASSLME
jgi:hypothetical protein